MGLEGTARCSCFKVLVDRPQTVSMSVWSCLGRYALVCAIAVTSSEHASKDPTKLSSRLKTLAADSRATHSLVLCASLLHGAAAYCQSRVLITCMPYCAATPAANAGEVYSSKAQGVT